MYSASTAVAPMWRGGAPNQGHPMYTTGNTEELQVVPVPTKRTNHKAKPIMRLVGRNNGSRIRTHFSHRIPPFTPAIIVQPLQEEGDLRERAITYAATRVKEIQRFRAIADRLSQLQHSLNTNTFDSALLAPVVVDFTVPPIERSAESIAKDEQRIIRWEYNNGLREDDIEGEFSDEGDTLFLGTPGCKKNQTKVPTTHMTEQYPYQYKSNCAYSVGEESAEFNRNIENFNNMNGNIMAQQASNSSIYYKDNMPMYQQNGYYPNKIDYYPDQYNMYEEKNFYSQYNYNEEKPKNSSEEYYGTHNSAQNCYENNNSSNFYPNCPQYYNQENVHYQGQDSAHMSEYYQEYQDPKQYSSNMPDSCNMGYENTENNSCPDNHLTNIEHDPQNNGYQNSSMNYNSNSQEYDSHRNQYESNGLRNSEYRDFQKNDQAILESSYAPQNNQYTEKSTTKPKEPYRVMNLNNDSFRPNKHRDGNEKRQYEPKQTFNLDTGIIGTHEPNNYRHNNNYNRNHNGGYTKDQDTRSNRIQSTSDGTRVMNLSSNDGSTVMNLGKRNNSTGVMGDNSHPYKSPESYDSDNSYSEPQRRDNMRTMNFSPNIDSNKNYDLSRDHKTRSINRSRYSGNVDSLENDHGSYYDDYSTNPNESSKSYGSSKEVGYYQQNRGRYSSYDDDRTDTRRNRPRDGTYNRRYNKRDDSPKELSRTDSRDVSNKYQSGPLKRSSGSWSSKRIRSEDHPDVQYTFENSPEAFFNEPGGWLSLEEPKNKILSKTVEVDTTHEVTEILLQNLAATERTRASAKDGGKSKKKLKLKD